MKGGRGCTRTQTTGNITEQRSVPTTGEGTAITQVVLYAKGHDAAAVNINLDS